ncbi:transporter substrate-binding domain-containing protein [Hahella sp. CR1]|uniref:substrate-binding periplasmic protein n=1 Tax=Hahella sp. CR1 TaxID=2992807 RepID=UPI002442C6F6|nr:transporter substrate-binding domain-containing protein [Hahella sp. CR1]MDG9670595.1 transporter substrate-binding domain-containing protein [Hahella sp. CR1]
MRYGLWLWFALFSQGLLAQTLIIGMEDANNKPFEYVTDSGELTGFHTEVVKQVTASLGWKVEFVRLPWTRVIKMLESGEVNAVTYMAKSIEREKFALYLPDNLLHISQSTIYIKKSRANEILYDPPLEHFVTRWRVAVPTGYHINDEAVALIRNNYPLQQRTVTMAQLFLMLVNDRYDAILGGSNAMLRSKTAIENLEDVVQPLQGALFPSEPMYIGFSRQSDTKLAYEFAIAYKQFRQQPAYREIAERFNVIEWLPGERDFD